MSAALEVRDLVVRYRGRTALEVGELVLGPGRRLGVVGPNGAGKSTLLHALVGLVRVERGTVTVAGRAVAHARGRIAFLAQRQQVDLDHPAQVRDVVAMGRYPRRGPVGRLRRGDRERVEAAIARVGLTGFARRRIGELSGGQQQRAFLARALAQEADVLLLDEPYAGLDAVTVDVIDRVLAEAAAGGAAVVVVDHDLAGLRARYDRLLLLNRRVVADGPPAQVLTRTALAATYGPGALLDTVVEP